MAAKLNEAPITFDFVTAKGTTESRQLTIADLETAASGYLYSPYGRFLLVRAIVAASHEDYVPIARLAYDAVSLDPETLEVQDDPTYSDLLYYAVECQDYAFYPDGADPDARLASWVARGTEAGVQDLRLGVVYYGDVPCLYWPSSPDDERAPGADPRPALPDVRDDRRHGPGDAHPERDADLLAAARRVLPADVGRPARHLRLGRVVPGRPDHGVAGHRARRRPRGSRCATARSRGRTCPVAEPSAADYDDALDFATTMDDQLLNTDDYGYRYDGETALIVGCDFGGTVTYAPTDAGHEDDAARRVPSPRTCR